MCTDCGSFYKLNKETKTCEKQQTEYVLTVLMKVVIGASVLLAIISLSYVGLFFMFNMFQMLLGCMMLRVYNPEMIFDFIKEFNFAAGQFKSLSQVPFGWFETTWTYNIRVPMYADFRIVNEHSGSFIVNEF